MDMDFSIKKPLHIIAFILILITFLFVIVAPLLTFFNVLPSIQNQETEQMISVGGIFFEIFLLIIQLVIVIATLILIPVLWYLLVNKISIKDSLKKMRLTFENIDIAFLWGFVSVILIFGIIFVIELFLIYLGFNPEDMGNLQDLEYLFSPVTLFLLISIQPIAEEIFFRGFLLEKIEGFAGKNIAIASTSILFGVAHMSYGDLYPVLIPIFIGAIFAIIVIKTKSLYSSIIAHVIFNVSSFALAMLARSIT